MSIRIAATKTNLLKTKRTLSLCKEGHRLLDEKRKILLIEISSIAQRIQEIQKDIDDSLSKVYESIEKCTASMGKTGFEKVVAGIDTQLELEISERKVMGAIIPKILLMVKENPPFFSPLNVNHHLDESIFLMRDALKYIVVLAEKKVSLMRLEQEFLKTTKKVNALEKIHIPYYSEVVRVISDRLDEESREAFATLKEIKKRLSSTGV